MKFDKAFFVKENPSPGPWNCFFLILKNVPVEGDSNEIGIQGGLVLSEIRWG
jgi:hypothetical protein